MDVIIERACGLDVHKDNITACIMTPERKEIQTFSTKTVFLLKLMDWIKEHGCTHVAMESTVFIGNRLLIYWSLKELSF
jgi:transposase